MENEYDIAIVGGGIVGLATAFELQKKYPNLKLIILEKEVELAFHQSGRNSGVLHSGLYYQPGSLKAKNCVSGRKKLVEFAKTHSIAHDVCGKIVVALDRSEHARLVMLKENGRKNGLEGLCILNSEQVKEIEPFVEAYSGLFVPDSGIIDYKSVVNEFANQVRDINPKTRIQTSTKVLSIREKQLLTTKGVINVKHTIFCGGLFADRLARQDSLSLDMQIVGFRGDYYQLTESSRNMVKHLIYPVPNPEFPFLGIHFTRMTDGRIECGPNAVFTFKREGYKRNDFDFKDSFQALSFIGTWRLFINHWKFGLKEYRRAYSKQLFLKELQKIIPSLTISDIKVCRSGVRAMALEKNGKMVDDFRIVKSNNNLHVLNAPSPAATACMSIGCHVVEQAEKHFQLNTIC